MAIKSYEVVFHRYNFLHLTGVKLNNSQTASPVQKVYVIMSKTIWREVVYNMERKIYKELELSEKQIKEGKIRDAREALASIRKKYTSELSQAKPT